MSNAHRSFASVILMMGIICSSVAIAAQGDGKHAGKKAEAKKKSRKPGARGFNLLKVDSIITRLGKKALSAEQEKKIEILREELRKKYIEINNRDDVMAAREAVKKAGKDKAALKKARAELEKVTGGFSASAEYQEGLKAILSEEQLKALKASRKRAASAGEKAKEPSGKG